ncbi:MAG: hypothetical protein IH602_00920 [Bryobacteraceae bacterium]|nr:hypothetical protein [Bryobacteraceae bacterium]
MRRRQTEEGQGTYQGRPEAGLSPNDHEEREVPPPDELRAILNMQPRESELVFPRVKGGRETRLLRRLKPEAKLAKGEDATLHKFLHSCGSAGTFSKHCVAAALGWLNRGSTKRWSRGKVKEITPADAENALLLEGHEQLVVGFWLGWRNVLINTIQRAFHLLFPTGFACWPDISRLMRVARQTARLSVPAAGWPALPRVPACCQDEGEFTVQ